MIRNAVQHSENVRNSLVLNYKSAALPAELCRRSPYESCFQCVDQEFVMTISRTALQKGPNFHGIFLRRENGLGLPGAGSSPPTWSNAHIVRFL